MKGSPFAGKPAEGWMIANTVCDVLGLTPEGERVHEMRKDRLKGASL
jgi:prophage antirepressor-like protein